MSVYVSKKDHNPSTGEENSFPKRKPGVSCLLTRGCNAVDDKLPNHAGVARSSSTPVRYHRRPTASSSCRSCRPSFPCGLPDPERSMSANRRVRPDRAARGLVERRAPARRPCRSRGCRRLLLAACCAPCRAGPVARRPSPLLSLSDSHHPIRTRRPLFISFKNNIFVWSSRFSSLYSIFLQPSFFISSTLYQLPCTGLTCQILFYLFYP